MWLLMALFACNTKMDEATVKGAIDSAFKEANAVDGHYGWEMPGKGQWFKGADFNSACLKENDLAFSNYQKPGQISPVYQVQHMLTASTKKGYCIDMGGNLSYDIESIEPVSKVGSVDMQEVTLKFNLDDTTPWFSCLNEDVLTRVIFVEGTDGVPSIDTKYSMAFQENNGCPNPVPAFKNRMASAKPETAPAKEPTLEEIRKLAQQFDDALFSRDFEKAQDMISCVNLYETNKWGTCSLAELLVVGPSTHGESRVEDGAPWLEYTQYNLKGLKKVVKDKEDPTLFHVVMPHRKTKKERSFSVQWTNGRLKIFGVVSILGAGITPLRLMNDLHDKTYRDAFEKRLAGEEVDYKGKLLDPNAEEEE